MINEAYLAWIRRLVEDSRSGVWPSVAEGIVLPTELGRGVLVDELIGDEDGPGWGPKPDD